jgi:hypothetical protein
MMRLMISTVANGIGAVGKILHKSEPDITTKQLLSVALRTFPLLMNGFLFIEPMPISGKAMLALSCTAFAILAVDPDPKARKMGLGMINLLNVAGCFFCWKYAHANATDFPYKEANWLCSLPYFADF